MARRTAEIHRFRPMNVHVMRGSLAELKYRTMSGVPDLHPDVLAPGLPPTPAHNLMFHGGKTILNLMFTNFYIGGDAWSDSDIENIDGSLAAAMSEPTLNNVMAQYFPTIPTSNFRPSQKLAGAPPATVSQGDAEQLVRHLFETNVLDGHDLGNTVFNLMLPRGTVLNDNAEVGMVHERPRRGVPHEEEASSLNGSAASTALLEPATPQSIMLPACILKPRTVRPMAFRSLTPLGRTSSPHSTTS